MKALICMLERILLDGLKNSGLTEDQEKLKVFSGWLLSL